MLTRLLAFALTPLLLISCDRKPKPDATSPQQGGQPMSIQLSSSAFSADQPIPKQFTEDGLNVSPALAWSNVPAGTKELALIVDDPDAPTPAPWVHWVIYKIPPQTAGLPEGVAKDAELQSPAGAVQGKNSYKRLGFDGPGPPPGKAHRYFFHLYALDAPLGVKSGLDKDELLKEMQGHVLAQGQLVGTYRR